MKRFSATHRPTKICIRVDLSSHWPVIWVESYLGNNATLRALPGFIRYLESTAKKLRKLTKEKK